MIDRTDLTETGFFLSGEVASRAYRNIRDLTDGPVPEARLFVESLWTNHADIISIDGESYRKREAEQAQKRKQEQKPKR